MAVGGTSRTEVPAVVAMLVAPRAGARGTETGGASVADSSQQGPLIGTCWILTGGMLVVVIPASPIPASPIAICCIAGIRIQQTDRAATGNTSSVIASPIETNLDRTAITVCILLSAEDVFCD